MSRKVNWYIVAKACMKQATALTVMPISKSIGPKVT